LSRHCQGGGAAPWICIGGRATPCGWNPGGAPRAPGYATGVQAGAADAAAAIAGAILSRSDSLA
jgi:hypothetical protein